MRKRESTGRNLPTETNYSSLGAILRCLKGKGKRH